MAKGDQLVVPGTPDSVSRSMEDAVNDAVLRVSELEGELRVARQLERQARKALALSKR